MITPENYNVLVIMMSLVGLFFAIVFAVVIRSSMRTRANLRAAQAKLQEQAKLLETAAASKTEMPRGSKDTKPEAFKTDEPGPRPEKVEPTTLAPTAAPKEAPFIAVPPAAEPLLEKKPQPEQKPEEPSGGVLISDALSNTRGRFWGRIKDIFGGAGGANLDDLEEILYTSDLGPKTVERLLEELTPAAKQGLPEVKLKLRAEFTRIFDEAHSQEPGVTTLEHLNLKHSPSVWLVVGVNGAGKTTSIGKISAQLASQGKKVLVAAGDTFRAAAGSQLKVWTDRADSAGEGEGAVEIFHPENVTDPSAIAFDAVSKAKARNFDVVLIDTAGRLHTQAHLMDELKKVKRVMTKVIPDAPHETLIVLDANNGQNALQQAKEFNAAVTLTGVILTKMDGTAKGGVAVGVSHELKLPIRLIGVGEKVQDLRPFSSRDFIDSILGEA